MTPDLVVAIDCSTTAVKAVILDADGAVLAAASRPLETIRLRPAWHEQDAQSWWTATLSAVSAAVEKVDAERIGAICLTHQRETVVCLDAAGVPLRPAILWLDGRAHREIVELGSDEVHRVSGKPPDTTPAIYKLAWLSRHEPQVLSTAARVGDVQAFLALRMTGRWATSLASADTLGLMDLRQRTWSPDLLALAGVRPDQLPDLVPAGSPIGLVTHDVSSALGLQRPVPLIAGLGDGQSAGLALGATESGVAYLNLGTSMVLGLGSNEYVWSSAFRTLDGMTPESYTLETVLNAAAYLTEWCRRELGPASDAADGDLARFEAVAANIPPGCEGLLTLPYWNAAQTPYWDPLARGALVGLHGRHTRAHIYRSILEGVAFELRLHLEQLEAASGVTVTAIRAVGGGARSTLWMRIVADVTQRPVEIFADGEASAAGAGVLAHAWLGGRTQDLRFRLSRSALIQPDPEVERHYSQMFAIYRGLYDQLKGSFHALAEVYTDDVSPST